MKKEDIAISYTYGVSGLYEEELVNHLYESRRMSARHGLALSEDVKNSLDYICKANPSDRDDGYVCVTLDPNDGTDASIDIMKDVNEPEQVLRIFLDLLPAKLKYIEIDTGKINDTVNKHKKEVEATKRVDREREHLRLKRENKELKAEIKRISALLKGGEKVEEKNS